jgi:hypothetical protein
MLSAKTQFLGDASDAEGLAGKSCTQDVMLGNVRNGDLVNVTMRLFAEIGLVGDLRVFVPIRGKHAFAASTLKGKAKAAYAAKQINETMLMVFGRAIGMIRGRILPQSACALTVATRIRFLVFCFGHDEPKRILSRRKF